MPNGQQWLDNLSVNVPPRITSTNRTVPLDKYSSFQPVTIDSWLYPVEDPITFSASNLPPGLTIESGYGNVSGTPTQEGIWQSKFSVSNSLGTSEAEVTITVADGFPSFQLPPGQDSLFFQCEVGKDFTYQIPADLAVSFSLDWLPSDLGINCESNGALHGIPNYTGTFWMNVTALNEIGSTSCSLLLCVLPPRASTRVS